ncbi:hypothetical protein CPB85DRAFT_775467 [Mucidula mucida]|nr:hypothetical protein CPB85DRAFT_775467 [Mucidula mucida]
MITHTVAGSSKEQENPGMHFEARALLRLVHTRQYPDANLSRQCNEWIESLKCILPHTALLGVYPIPYHTKTAIKCPPPSPPLQTNRTGSRHTVLACPLTKHLLLCTCFRRLGRGTRTISLYTQTLQHMGDHTPTLGFRILRRIARPIHRQTQQRMRRELRGLWNTASSIAYRYNHPHGSIIFFFTRLANWSGRSLFKRRRGEHLPRWTLQRRRLHLNMQLHLRKCVVSVAWLIPCISARMIDSIRRG